ncbi:hypothetical protein MBLNU13_g07431t1 [Cladosporium sp. NU13]
MPPYISTRAFIQWLPDDPSEPTSTQVLTSSQRRFVDIRVPADPALEGVNPAHVEWAFAGHSKSNVVNGKNLSQWHHWIDSKTTRPEDVVDKGEMLPEDDSGLALEKGEMVNPATGLLTEYIEGWRDGEIGVVPKPGEEVVRRFYEELRGRGVSVDGLRAGSVGGGDLRATDASSRLSVVLQHEDAARGSRGMAIRLGHICQGVMRVGYDFAHERWEWSQGDGWRQTSVSGKLSMPCDILTILAEQISTDSTIKFGNVDDLRWQCVEAERF